MSSCRKLTHKIYRDRFCRFKREIKYVIGWMINYLLLILNVDWKELGLVHVSIHEKHIKNVKLFSMWFIVKEWVRERYFFFVFFSKYVNGPRTLLLVALQSTKIILHHKSNTNFSLLMLITTQKSTLNLTRFFFLTKEVKIMMHNLSFWGFC